MNLIKIEPFLKDGLVRVVIETPKGSRNKLSFDPDLKAFVLKKTLPQGMVFPFDFGFVPQTQGEDGDPLDVLVLMPETLSPGTVVECRIIGVIKAEQREGKSAKSVRNDRYLAVSETACEFSEIQKPENLPENMLEQLEKFFINYNELEGREFKLRGVKGAKAATKDLRRARTKEAESV